MEHKVFVKIRAIHKELKTSADITEVLLRPDKIQVYNFIEYGNIILHYVPSDDNKFDEAEEQIRKIYNYDNFRNIYSNHWFCVSVTIKVKNGPKEVTLNFDDSFNSYFSFHPDNYIITVSAPLTAAYTEINGYQKSLESFPSYVKFLEFTESEKRIIAELNEKQYLETPKDFKKPFYQKILPPSLFPKKEVKENDISFTDKESTIFDASILNIADGMINSDLALKELIGLGNVKAEIEKLKAKLEYRKKQEKRNVYNDQNGSMHMCFLGAPGTGKTTVARIVTGILYDLGYIKSNKCIEVNAQNLKGGYIGQTAIITKAVMRNARNKVLFIDEAYALFDDFENGYGKEAVAVILKEMEDNRDNMIVIFAGYDNEMQKFLKMNDGLKSRINRYIHFENYSPAEMLQIMMMFLAKRRLYITEDSLKICLDIFKEASFNPRFSNARFVRNLVEKIEEEHIYNVHNIKDITRKDTILPEDISDEIVKELLEKSM
jgi:AAA+ superfamily predicted ATPase